MATNTSPSQWVDVDLAMLLTVVDVLKKRKG